MQNSTFERYKIYYEDGLWSINMLRNAVRKGKITAEEFELITHEPYESEAV